MIYPRRPLYRVFGHVALLLVASLGSASAEGPPTTPGNAPNKEAQYPYDPACAWGRIADGKGMLLRCLTQAESVQLMAVKAPGAATSADTPPVPKDPEVPATPGAALTAQVVSVVADTGKLPLGVRKLSAAHDRFVDCVQKHGGLSADSGEVHVRFLVRQRGRAEGVSVSKRRAVSEEAARCVAEVVDRRSVGIPEAPLVGATVVVKFAPVGS